MGEPGTWFAKGLRWGGVNRKREFSDFHADPHTLGLVHAAFYVAFRSILEIERQARGEENHFDCSGMLLSALREANSIATELENLAAAVNHEKY